MTGFNRFNHIKKARKEHECAVCGRQIDIGESCDKFTGTFDNDFQSWYACKTCIELQDEFLYANDNYCEPEFVREVIADKIYGWKCPICGVGRDDFELDTKNNTVIINCEGDPRHTHRYRLLPLVQENKLITEE